MGTTKAAVGSEKNLLFHNSITWMLGKTQLDNADQFFTERSLSVVSHSNGTILLEKNVHLHT